MKNAFIVAATTPEVIQSVRSIAATAPAETGEPVVRTNFSVASVAMLGLNADSVTASFLEVPASSPDSLWISHTLHLETVYTLDHDLATSIILSHYQVKALICNNTSILIFGLAPNVFVAKEVLLMLPRKFRDLWAIHRLKLGLYGREERRRRDFITGVYDRVRSDLSTRRQRFLDGLPVFAPIGKAADAAPEEKPLPSPALIQAKAALEAAAAALETNYKEACKPGKGFVRRTHGRRTTTDYRAGYTAGGSLALPDMPHELAASN